MRNIYLVAWAVSCHLLLLDFPNHQCPAAQASPPREWLRFLGEPSRSAKPSTVSAGVWAAALGKTVPAFHKGLGALVQSRWFQFEAYTQRWSCIEFLPWNQQNLLQHFAWIKIFVPFFTGQKEDSWSLQRKEIITGPTEVGHVRQLLIV